MSHSLVTPWTVPRQAPLSMGYYKEEFEAGLPFPPPGDLSDPETESVSPAAPVSQADPLVLSHQGSSISALREVRSLLESAATSHEKRGLWCLLGTVADTLFTVSTKATSPSRQGFSNSLHR